MNRLNIAALLSSLGMLLFALSCAAPMSLVSINLSPTSASINGLGARIPVQFTAYGNFIHPSKVVDLTKEVTWASAAPDVASVNSAGLVTPAGVACGNTIITATAGKGVIGPGNDNEIVTGTATFAVTDPNVPGCQQP